MLQETHEISVARQWAAEIFGFLNVPKFYMAEENLIAAYRDGDSLSFILKGDPVYMQAYGEHPHIDQRWEKVALSSINPIDIDGLEPRYGFQFWARQTHESPHQAEIITDYDLINSILDSSAPESSVRPGGSEEIFWAGVRNEVGEIASIGVVVKWQSGNYVLASVASRTEDRGKGYATLLAAGASALCAEQGIPEIGLGVRDNNFAAQRAYEKAGYTKLAAFKNYFRG